MWEFYLPVSSISGRELWTLAVESGLKIATKINNSRLHAVVDGHRDIIEDFYNVLRKSYAVSDLHVYTGLTPNFDEEIKYVQLESQIEYTALLAKIAEQTRILAAHIDGTTISSNLAKNIAQVIKKAKNADNE